MAVLGLAVPLAAQATVNSLAQGMLWQPVVLFSTLVFVGVLLAGALKVSIYTLAETVQQRLFARIGLGMAQLLPEADSRSFQQLGGVREMNKFFEVVNLQKSWNKLLVDVPTSTLEIALYFGFLLFYAPWLALASLGLILCLILLMTLLGMGGLRTSIAESAAKYRLAEWLQSVGGCQEKMQLNCERSWVTSRADKLGVGYLDSRQLHFGALFRQMVAWAIVHAFLGAGVLALGGWAVLQGQLSLGQLVAVELVIWNLLKAGEKLVQSVEPSFDLLTGLIKLAPLAELPRQEQGRSVFASSSGGANLRVQGVFFSYSAEPLLSDVRLEVAAGQRVHIRGDESAGRSTLGRLMVGLLRPTAGRVEVNGFDLTELTAESRSGSIGWVNPRQLLLGESVEHNVLLGRDFSSQQLNWALELSGLQDHLAGLADGLKSPVDHLSSTQGLRLLVASAIVSRPALLVIDADLPLSLRQALRAPELPWTLVELGGAVPLPGDRALRLTSSRLGPEGEV